MSGISDDALRKAFIETQAKLQSTSRQHAGVKAQLQGRQREQKICELASKELSSFPPETTAYKAVGKMFLKADLAVLNKNMLARAADAGKECIALERAAKKLERDMVDAENGLKELLQRRVA
ncbi:Prefoldin subunit 1 [Chytridiales sp. JEL 0842]|nr:Prefoldin subunit 1 [Chytridiales sp. JEL 0842]